MKVSAAMYHGVQVEDSPLWYSKEKDEMAIKIFQGLLDRGFTETAAAGVGAMLPILGALFTALHAFSQSGASIVSQYIGAKQNSHANSTQTMVLFGSILLGVALTLIVYPLSGNIPRWMGLTEAPAVYAQQFLSIVSFGFAFRALQTILTALIATHGLTIWNFVGNTLTIASNAALNVIFLEGLFGLPKMGVYGVALATALSWLISSGSDFITISTCTGAAGSISLPSGPTMEISSTSSSTFRASSDSSAFMGRTTDEAFTVLTSGESSPSPSSDQSGRMSASSRICLASL